jgi:hypothetical protein
MPPLSLALKSSAMGAALQITPAAVRGSAFR